MMVKICQSVFLFLTTLLIASCSKQNELHLYIDNASADMPLISVSIYLNDSLVVNDSVHYTELVPDYQEYRIEEVAEGRYDIRILGVFEGGIISELDTLNIYRDKHVFVTFNFKNKGGYEYQEEKMKFDLMYPKNKYPDKVFEFDSVLIPPEINIRILNEKPVFE